MWYFLDNDNCGHWYVIPVKNKKAWEKWISLDEDDEKSWILPKFVICLEGGPQEVIFKEWKTSWSV